MLYYYLTPKSKDDEINDNQPEVLSEELVDENSETFFLPKTIPLMLSKKKLQCRKVKSVLRYHVTDQHKFPEKYAHYAFFLCFILSARNLI